MKKIPFAWIPLIAGLVISLLAAHAVRLDITDDERERFAHAADQITLKIRERLESHELILRGGAGLFAASPEVGRQQWKAFVDALHPESIIPGLQGIGFSQLIQKHELDTHTARIRAEGFAGYKVKPEDDRPVYSSIIYLEPFRDRNLLAFGYDMFSEPVRRAAMTQARDTGEAALSGKVELVQEAGDGGQAGALMYFPVYRKGLATDTVKQRQTALIGWTYSPFRMNDLMNSALLNWKSQLGKDLHLTLYDGDQFRPEAVLFRTSDQFTRHVDHPFHQHRIVEFRGHQWLLALDRRPQLTDISYAPAWLTLAGGFVISLLLFRLLQSMAQTRRRAERIAEQLTLDIRQKEQQLRETEFRWKFALEGSDLGVWDWNIAEGTVFFTKRWKEMLGHTEDEIGTGLDEWSKRIHPDDLQATMAMIEAYLEGRSPNYDCEHRVRCKNGSYLWIRDRGIAVERDGNGKPLRMIGTHADVTGRKTMEESLRQHEAELLDAQRIARVGSWRLDLATNHVVWSGELYRMFGLDPALPPPDVTTHSRMFAPDSWKLLSTALTLTREEGVPYELELQTVAANGSKGWMLVRGEATRNIDGRITGMRGVATDITERKRAEEALIASRELLRSIVENAPIRVFWKDAELRYLGCNSLFARDAGLSRPEDVVGKDDSQMSWQKQAVLYQADDRRVMDSGIPKLGYEEPQTSADGRTIWLRTSKVPLRDDSGKVFGMLGIYDDITEQKQSESNIRHLTRLYAALSECNAAVIHCTNQAELFKRLCEVVVDLGGVAMAWIGLTDTSGRIVPVASYGSGLEYLEDIKVTIDSSEPQGRGPTGTAIRENRAMWINDFRTSSITTPWQHRASPYGWLSSAALPICRGGQPVGALTFYSTETGGWRNEQTRDLLGKMVSSINFALDKLAAAAEAEASHATLVESEQRFRTVVEQSIAGVFIIQDDRLVYANPRFAQILGYADGNELVGIRPIDFVAPQDQAMADAASKAFDSGSGNMTLSFTALRKDGSTVDVGLSASQSTYQQRPALIGLMQDISDKKVAEDQIRRYAKQLEHSFMQMVTLATTLSEMRDAYTAGHEKRVAEIAMAIGAEMGLDKTRVEGLRVSGHLHDVGKVSIPTELLAKPGRLTPAEFALIKTHPEAGFEVLKGIEFPWPVAEVALQHHERIDGSGYPKGLKGDDIILEARIIAVADVVESMASHRPYRPALGIDKALVEIERGSGVIYDPAVATACLRLFRDKGFVLPV